MQRTNKRCVGIISYNINSTHLNYGAVLHSYAFQQYLQNQDVNSVIINYIIYPHKKYKYPFLNHLAKSRAIKSYKYPIISYNKSLSSFLWSILNWGILGFWSHRRKYKKFQSFFTSHYIKTEKCYSSWDLLNIKKIEKFPIDTYVCESDVTWKLYYENGFDDIFFLNFPLANKAKKVAYAPSIGSRLFTEKEQSIIRTLTAEFTAISSREKVGAEYLSKVLSRNVEWCLDPVFLLTEAQYDTILIKPKENKYLLLYNCVANDREMIKEAQKLAYKLHLKLIEISSFTINKLRFSHKIKSDIGIEEFLGYFKYADFVICNSFHGCCFSTIFKKQFFLFQRNTKDFRMKDITEGLGCTERMIPWNHKVIPDRFTPINYDMVYKRLEILKNKSYEFIKKNIIE